MPFADKEFGKKWHREYQSKKRKLLGDWLAEIRSVPCKACGNSFHFSGMDFHHIDESSKSFSIQTNAANYSKEKLQEEIDKCIILCATCHRFYHWFKRDVGL